MMSDASKTICLWNGKNGRTNSLAFIMIDKISKDVITNTYFWIPDLEHGVKDSLRVFGIERLFFVDIIKHPQSVESKVHKGFDVNKTPRVC